MEGSSLVLAVCRAFQLLFAIVVVGTSASLTKLIVPYANNCNGPGCSLLQNLVPRVEFGIFVGALGMVDAAMGLLSTFVDIIPYLIQLGADVLAGLSYVAGGAVLAAWLAKPFICDGTGGEHCTQLKADDAFMFLGFIISVVIIGLSFMWRGKTGKSGSYV